MAANSALIVTGLSFDQIRLNLRNYIAAKSEFTDYDFNDSAISTLLDLLAYNTYYNAFYTNMAASEAFIDSAQFYDSVVSRAKLVGYTPSSAKGATANVQITFTSAVPSANTPTLTIAKNTKFTSVINGVSYIFVTPKSYTVPATANVFTQAVDLVEGIPLTHRYLYTTSNTVFVLPNASVDTSSVTVSITSGANSQTYLLVDDITTINSSSKIFYVEADRDSKYKLLFGDNILGQRPDYNSTINISYRVCNATRANGAKNFTATGLIAGETSFTLSINDSATGGTDQETIDSIRFNAPRKYQTQNRAVTTSDYQRIILSQFPELQGVAVWGGEDNIPPIYGKVYIAAKPYSGTLISQSTQNRISETLRKYNMQSIQVEFTDPTFLYIVPTISSQYDPTITTNTASQIGAAIATRVISYESTQLNRFDGKFRFSRFLDYIDSSEASIVSSTASLALQKRFIPSITSTNTYTFTFNRSIATPLTNTAITSTAFTYQGQVSYLDDDGNENIRIYYLDGPNKIFSNSRAGSVNYVAGTITLNSFAPTAYDGLYMAINANPVTLNISPVRNQILLLSGSTVNVVNDDTGNVDASVSEIATVGETTTTRETGLPESTAF